MVEQGLFDFGFGFIMTHVVFSQVILIKPKIN